MLAQSHARKPAPPLAARGMWLRLHGGADAFGSALGDSIVGAITQKDQRQAPAPIVDKSQRVVVLADGSTISEEQNAANIRRSIESGATADGGKYAKLGWDGLPETTTDAGPDVLGKSKPLAQMREMSAGESFLTFNSVGKALKGYSDSALSILRSPLTAVEGLGNLLSDAYGYSKDAIFGPEVGVLGDVRPYEAQNSLVRSVQSQGVLGTLGDLTVSSVKALPGISQIDSLYRNDPYSFGASLPGTALALSGAGLTLTDGLKLDIPWGKGISAQGYAWENYLANQMPQATRLPANFKTFDFFDQQSGVAVSAKTIDTQTAARLAKPEQIYRTMKAQIDATTKFEDYTLKGVTLDRSMIAAREVQIAIPKATTAAQMEQINRAIQYGQKQGVGVTVTKVR